MSKFEYNNFYLDDNEWCVCNAKKYTKEQALEIAKSNCRMDLKKKLTRTCLQ